MADEIENKPTVENTKLLGGKLLSKTDDGVVQQLIDDAWLEVTHQGFPKFIREEAARYLACHFANFTSSQGLGVASEQVGPLKRSYFSAATTKSLNSDPFGAWYWRLFKEYCRGNNPLDLTVI